MRISPFVLMLLLIAALSCEAAYADGVRYETTWQGVKRSYVVKTPSNVERSSPRPLVVLLHGSGRRGKIMIDEWSKLADEQQIILVAPDSKDARAWRGPVDGPGFLRKVVEEVCEAYPVDRLRVYLFGHSAGAYFALAIGLMESEYFAAVAVHAGAIAEANESFAGVATRKIPIALWTGDRDKLVLLSSVRRTADLLERNEFPVQLSVMPRHDHNYYAVSKSVNAQAWRFLSGYSLEKAAYYVDYGDRDEPQAEGAH